jgi:hypothetical protein
VSAASRPRTSPEVAAVEIACQPDLSFDGILVVAGVACTLGLWLVSAVLAHLSAATDPAATGASGIPRQQSWRPSCGLFGR